MHTFTRRVLSLLLTGLVLLAFVGSPAAAQSQATIGQEAPDFTLTDLDGNEHSLSNYKGKYVVLEWLNFQCPYVDQHYGSGHMQELQSTYTDKEVVWLSIVSSAEGKQGYHPPEEMKAQKNERGADMSAILMDTSGTVGKTYGARTTPHMYVIGPEGELLYKGGIDDWATADTGTTLPTDTYITEEATNYVERTFAQTLNGKKVNPKRAQPYGCSVKYASND